MYVSVVRRPEPLPADARYTTNRPPLLPSPLAKLPLGAVQPLGWLARQLELMAEGMTGHLEELSPFLAPENGWLGGDREGWEEQAYWFRGFYDLAALTGDARLSAIADRWIEAVLGSQDADGYFGARYHKAVAGQNGQVVCDLWPHMIMLDAVIHHHERTGDPRVIPFLSRFFAFCRDLPDERFVPEPRPGFGGWKPFVQWARAGDMLPHLYWLYNRTGEGWLLDLARRFYQRIAPPVSEWLSDHIVDFTQRFQYAGTYMAQAGDPWYLARSEYWYAQHLGTWGQQPRGIFGADERIRSGKVDPRQGFETCGMVEFAKSFYLLGRLTGDPLYADRCEDVMLNHFPSASTPDLKALHYLTAANQPQLDAGEQHDFYNRGRQVSYSPHIYRCCQHNVAMGWPWYVQNLWQAAADGGLVAWMYAASRVAAQVGASGETVVIESRTDYPFRGGVELAIEAARPVTFPLYLRVPRWCRGFHVRLNGERVAAEPAPGTYLRLEREWRRGDRVALEMDMAVSLTRWPRNGSVTVDRGPLSYSVRIGERWQRCGGTDEWPEWEVYPATPWNYGLCLEGADPAAGLAVVDRGEVAAQPWTLEDAPIEIRATAKRLPGWRILENQTVDEVPVGPARSDEPEEEITLIPLGCARLRMSCLPVIADGLEAQPWEGSKPRNHFAYD